MAVPKNRHTKSRRNRRRAHIKLPRVLAVQCDNDTCDVLKPPHLVCEECGTYKGRQVVDVLKKMVKRDRKVRERAGDDESSHTRTV